MVLIYSGIMSLDGYVADQAGKVEWSVPDTEVHTAINDLTRSVGTFLLGRRMYEVLVALVGGGTSYLPDDTRVWLELLDERRFSNGVVFLRYASRT